MASVSLGSADTTVPTAVLLMRMAVVVALEVEVDAWSMIKEAVCNAEWRWVDSDANHGNSAVTHIQVQSCEHWPLFNSSTTLNQKKDITKG